MSFANAIHQWQEGERRVQAAPHARQAVLDGVTGRLVAELRRRLGGSFRSAELVDVYNQGTTWCLEIALAAAPDKPWAWDATVSDAAFMRYLREAADFAGGRLTDEG